MLAGLTRAPVQLNTAQSIDAEAALIVHAVPAAAHQVFGPARSRPDCKPFRDKISARLQQARARIAALRQRFLSRRADAASQLAFFIDNRDKVQRLTGQRPVSAGHAALLLRHKVRALTAEINSLADTMRKESIEQFNRMLERQNDRGSGFKQFSAKLAPPCSSPAVKRQDGSLAVEPDEVKQETRNHYLRLLGSRYPLALWSNPQPPAWAPFDQQQPALAEDGTISVEDIRARLGHVKLDGAPDIHGHTMALFYHAPPAFLDRLAALLPAIETVGHTPHARPPRPCSYCLNPAPSLTWATSAPLPLWVMSSRSSMAS